MRDGQEEGRTETPVRPPRRGQGFHLLWRQERASGGVGWLVFVCVRGWVRVGGEGVAPARFVATPHGATNIAWQRHRPGGARQPQPNRTEPETQETKKTKVQTLT